MFLDVSFYRKEILAGEFGSLLIFIRLGIQPSTGSSGRGRAEVQQDGLDCDVLAPIHAHYSRPWRNVLLQLRTAA